MLSPPCRIVKFLVSRQDLDEVTSAVAMAFRLVRLPKPVACRRARQQYLKLPELPLNEWGGGSFAPINWKYRFFN